MFKANGGFTLVELIVVIAILGILAVTAVPAYTEYISRAENAVASYNASEDAREAAIDAIADQYIP